MRGDRVAGVIIDELEDHTLPPTGENVFGAVELPAGVRCRIDKPTVRRPRFLLRLDPGDASVTEDPRQRRRRRNRCHPQGPHLVAHADRPMIQTRLLQRSPHPDRLLLHLVDRLLRTRPRSSRARLKRCRLALLESSSSDRVERLPRDPHLSAERRHRPARRIRWPLGDGKADTRINRLNTTHPPKIREKCQDQTPPKRQRSIDAELSEMS
jgi:hypothetical protein